MREVKRGAIILLIEYTSNIASSEKEQKYLLSLPSQELPEPHLTSILKRKMRRKD
jgi:hypothetical protein